MVELYLYSPKKIAHYYESKNIFIKKSLGQNFLVNKSICKKIVNYALLCCNSDCSLVEVGPGLGTLTTLLCQSTKIANILSIEKDTDFKDILTELKKLYPNKLSIIFSDFQNFDLSTIKKDSLIIGNLPYNMATHFITRFIKEGRLFNMLFMMQTEVVDRICAKPYSAKYGYLSVISQYFFNCKKIFDVSCKNFFPVPKVNSSIIHMKPITQTFNQTVYSILSNLLHSVFSQRRKVLTNSLKNTISNTKLFLEEVGVSVYARPEEISIEKYKIMVEKLIKM